jgi:hypothetical protein
MVDDLFGKLWRAEMKNTNGNLPAMPNVTDAQTLGSMGMMNTVADFYRHGAGLAKREMFAMAAMQGLLANEGDRLQKYIAADAVAAADALLAELERQA